jgi:uncharacterized protein (DUF1330 family)
MAAYVIAFVEVKDWQKYGDYTKVTPDVITQHGGRFIVRGGRSETLEGPKETRRIVVIEFPTYEQARAFYHSAEYTWARTLRAEAAEAEFVLVDGVGS